MFLLDRYYRHPGYGRQTQEAELTLMMADLNLKAAPIAP